MASPSGEAPTSPMEEDPFEESEQFMLALLVAQLDSISSPLRKMETYRP